jgi:hypothetical protein
LPFTNLIEKGSLIPIWRHDFYRPAVNGNYNLHFMNSEGIFYIGIMPSIHIGCIYFIHKIRRNQKYDVFISINWESVRKSERQKLFNLITKFLIVFFIISTLYWPLMYIFSIHFLIVFAVYIGLGLIFAAIVLSVILQYSR